MTTAEMGADAPLRRIMTTDSEGEALIPPRSIKVIDRTIKEGELHETVIDAWLALIEDAESGEGYRIVASYDRGKFGLATKGFPADEHLVPLGWSGDFMSAFKGM